MGKFNSRWEQIALRCAGFYNILWGILSLTFPEELLKFSGYPPLPYPQIWQGLGLVLGLYGVGYLIASRDPIRHWPIVFVGLLGKVLGPLGFAANYLQGSLPLSAGRLCIPNDIIWWIPFSLILIKALRYHQLHSSESIQKRELNDVIHTVRSNTGETLAALSAEHPLLLVFLRHAGCTFCREALSDVAKVQSGITANGTGIAFVHMSSPERAEEIFAPYGLEKYPRFSDPDQVLYRAFNLQNGTFQQLLGPSVFWQGLQGAFFRGHGFGMIEGNSLRMPGVFILKQGRIVAGNQLRNAAERPDYAGMACGVNC